MTVPKDFFSIATLLTLTGSATAVWIITSVLAYVFGFNPGGRTQRIIGLLLATILSLLAAALASEESWTKWVVAVVNGFVIYLTAVGVNSVAAHGSPNTGARSKPPVRKTGIDERTLASAFLTRWW